jgi:hypothetical protein
MQPELAAMRLARTGMVVSLAGSMRTTATSAGPGSCRGRGDRSRTRSPTRAVPVAVRGIAVLAEPGIVVEPGRVDLREGQRRPERPGDPAGPAGVDGVAALRQALLRRGVRLDRRHNRYYFLPDHETITRRVEARTKTGRAQSAKKVVRQEGAGTDHARDIWWHLAAQLRFDQFAPGSWGLTIRPEFQLTKDGREPLEPWRVGRKVTSRKSRMYNEGYFDAVHFFRYFLLDGRARFTMRVGRQAITVDGNFPDVDAKWPQIPDKRFDPVSMLDSGDEDDVLDALAGTLDSA